MIEVNNDLFERALIFAAKAHRGQSRKGNKLPYIIHPMQVCMTLQEVKESKNIILLMAVALLHDTVEDCGVSLKKIGKHFGLHVAALVEELTLDKDKYETIGKTKLLCQEVIKMSSYALCIKLADRLNNVRDTKSMSDDFKKKYFAETKEILNVLEDKRKLTGTQKKLVKLIKPIIGFKKL
jgi:myo-inositol-1(or 4)-monophosphatase